MESLVYIVAVCLLYSWVASASTTHCMTDAGCAHDECCYRHEGPMIVSKRDNDFVDPLNGATVQGVCQKYKHADDPCSPFEKLNGLCSCGPGLTCSFVPAPSTLLPKRKLYMPGPGSYRCVPHQ